MPNRLVYLAVAVLMLTGGSRWAVAADAARPNIVVILADDLGYGDVGCYNRESKIPTPHLDRLARQGMRFTDAHSPSTVCTPSRYSVLTGRMCFRTGFRGVFTGVDGPLIEPKRLTLPRMLKNAGYKTACVGKWHVGMTFFDKAGKPVKPRGGGVKKVRQVDFSRPIRNGPVDVGFDYFFGTACCPTTDWLYAYIENDRVVQAPTELVRPATKHWLEYEHFRAGLKSPDFQFRDVDLEFLKRSRAWLESHVKSQPKQPFFLYHATQSAHLPALPARRFVGKTKAGPLGDFVFEFDHVVGELMRTLDRLGVAQNTLLIVTSDNGPEIVITHMRSKYGHDSARPWRGFKRDNWEGGHRVPFIARWPGRIRPGQTNRQPICLTDIMATCAEVAGVKLPDDAAEDSLSLLAEFTGRPARNRAERVVLHQTISLALGIRRGRWKLLDHRGSGGNNYDYERLRPFAIPNTAPGAAGQLYDLSTDPGETRNLYRQRPKIAGELKRKLEALKKQGLRFEHD